MLELINPLKDLLLTTIEPTICGFSESYDPFYSTPPIEKKEPLFEPIKKITPPITPTPLEEEVIVKKAPSLEKVKTGFSNMKAILTKVAPHLRLIDQIPDDEIAKKIASRWKTKNQASPISILYGLEPPEYKKFLEEIAISLDVYFGGCTLIPIEKIGKNWESFLHSSEIRMILMCDATLWALPELRSFYKENTAQGTRTLQKVPLFLFPDFSLYFKDPLLKKTLWSHLCQKLTLK